MKNYCFFATLTACIQVSNEEVELLFNTAKNHNDPAINLSTHAGGFLYGLRCKRLARKDIPDNSAEFSQQQLNLIIKTLESKTEPHNLNLYRRLLYIYEDLENQALEINWHLNNSKAIKFTITKSK